MIVVVAAFNDGYTALHFAFNDAVLITLLVSSLSKRAVQTNAVRCIV